MINLKFNRIAPGYYKTDYRAYDLELTKVPSETMWYWEAFKKNGGWKVAGGDEWFLSKRDAVDALVEWLEKYAT